MYHPTLPYFKDRPQNTYTYYGNADIDYSIVTLGN